MRLLIIIGAGASMDCLRYEHKDSNIVRLPLAVDLFSLKDPQQKLLNHYRLMGLADELFEATVKNKHGFDLELELETINQRAEKHGDKNELLSLFLARFYLHNLIYDLQTRTLELSQGLTTYVTLLRRLQEWTREKPDSRFVNIINFNYDTLLEEAMNHVYGYDWLTKSEANPLTAYYSGDNLKIYKPHGSINWGRRIKISSRDKLYNNIFDILGNFDNLKISDDFELINPAVFESGSTMVKQTIPAIAIPFKTKDTFDESPLEMQVSMRQSISESDLVLTIGWKGGDANLVKLLRLNTKLKTAYVVSPSGDSLLNEWLNIEPLKAGFSTYVNGGDIHYDLRQLLTKI